MPPHDPKPQFMSLKEIQYEFGVPYHSLRRYSKPDDDTEYNPFLGGAPGGSSGRGKRRHHNIVTTLRWLNTKGVLTYIGATSPNLKATYLVKFQNNRRRLPGDTAIDYAWFCADHYGRGAALTEFWYHQPRHPLRRVLSHEGDASRDIINHNGQPATERLWNRDNIVQALRHWGYINPDPDSTFDQTKAATA